MPTPLDYFQMEAAERLERLGSGLVALERAPDDTELIGDLFREAHSLKGAAGVSGLGDVSDICHQMEDVFSGVRDHSRAVDAPMIDACLVAIDAVEKLVAAAVAGEDCDVGVPDIIDRFGSLGPPEEAPAKAPRRDEQQSGSAKPAAKREPEPDRDVSEDAPAEVSEARETAVDDGRRSEAPGTSKSTVDTIRLRVDMLDSLSNRTGELMIAGDRLARRVDAVKDLRNLIRGERNRYEEDHAVQETLKQMTRLVHRLLDEFTADVTVIEPLIAEIHDQVLGTRMLPLGVMFDNLPRFVRDFCRREDKQAELEVSGADIRVDRQVLEQLRDPMIHLIRNALSHGIESAERRAQSKKEPVGKISLTTSRRGDRIRITCEDDGGGIDRARILTEAVSQGMFSLGEAAELSPEETDRLILRPGFSTAEMITDVSGRGVGMDVVLSRMEALRGTLDIESEPGQYTRFILEFPASVATLEGLLVAVGGYTYVVPTTSVSRTGKVTRRELQTGAGGEVLANIEGEAVPVVMLAGVLGRTDCDVSIPNTMPVVIVRHGERRIAFGVDRVLGTQTVVGKGLGDHLRRIRGVSGATILGTGLPALILEPAHLVRDVGAKPRLEGGVEGVAKEEVQLDPLLIVDDSLTTRMMEKSILESAGYTVDTATSAEDALEKLEESTYRLFVCDVEMPGLNGFQLTRKLREDERFAETPIIIVTSLATDEHRREGLEAGANAYITKGEFDQNNLLDTVERLVGK